MLKRVFICFFVVLLLTTMVAPAFATSVTPPSSNSDKPGVEIDYIKLLNGSSAGAVGDWPNNSGGAAYDYVLGSYSDLFGFECRNDSSSFNTTIYPGSASSVELYCSNLFWSEGTRFTISDDGYDSFVITSVSISGVRNEVFINGDSYNIVPYSFSGTFAVNSHDVDLAYLIRKVVGDIEAYGDLVFLQDVKISFSFYSTDPDVPVGLYFSVNRALRNNYFVIWFRMHALSVEVHNTEVPGLFDWLLDSVNAFLNFELVPGITINRGFYIVVVIGLLVCFFKFFS